MIIKGYDHVKSNHTYLNRAKQLIKIIYNKWKLDLLWLITIVRN
jgi:hypothetical protein